MKTFHINLLLCANFVATVFAYYKKCYDEFSVCLITNTDDPFVRSKYRLSQLSADDWCKNNSSSLAIITNETVQSAITAFINDSSAKLDSDVITYAFRFNQSTWGWTNGVTAADLSVIKYYYGYGVLIRTVSEALFISHDRLATSNRKFICSYRSYNSNCPDSHEQFGMRCYKIHHKLVTWFDARNICLKEQGSDLATFEDGFPLFTSEWRRREEYWVGLWRERWIWRYYQSLVDIKYSNWEDEKPSATDGDCLCVRARTGKWTNCDCSPKYRFICIQDYASGSSSTVKTPATKMNIRTKTITTATTKLKTTQSTSSTIPTVGDPSFQFHSTPTLTLVDNSGNKMSEDASITLDSEQSSGWIPWELIIMALLAVMNVNLIYATPGVVLNRGAYVSQRLIIWVPLALLIVIIAVVVSRIVIGKLRKRKRQRESSNTCQPALSADTYATLKPAEASIEDRTYAELTLYETIEDEKQKNSK